ncbi:DUF3055 domain-containing protein [Metabacillus idriensis]|uniref:DUF3055 family protein n=1 Tax=Metabacillus idriensis TaxID=324768 RepID=A0A6I2M804_9BACI|nr:DUF3055 domain-containing protein [Metabacillus idriensis]MCM3594497.1 DUF3055 domain-containing protein [Metabacillus idriensis]MRX53472.1 DUF3055 family protein [Metabacillus idriensis]OHR73034.1 hypothetical protein HMPREF3291_20770 [Bacillus sp. HMSC76G11]
MNALEKFYDDTEQANVRYVGFASSDLRYDLAIVYSSMFFGKPLVVCLQTGKAALLDSLDIEDLELLKQTFRTDTLQQASELSDFFKDVIPAGHLTTQYE